MKHTIRTTTFLAVLAMLTAISGFAGERGEGKTGRQPCGLPNLTDAQKKQMEEIDQTVEKALIPLKAQVELKHAELNALLVAEKTDKAAIDKKIEEIGAIRVQIQKKRIGGRLEIRAILTPEQRIGFDKQSLMPRGGPMMDFDEGPGMERERMFMMRREGPPGCPSQMKHMREKEEVELKTE
jgi:Spy/CpxP family protein refolding chaperone